MIKLAKPYLPRKAIADVVKVLESGNLVQGSYVRKFEKALQDYLDVKYAILVSSGTSALHLSLMALGITEGDEVIVAAFSHPATANVVELVGGKPVFVDISLDDYCLDSALIEKAISRKTKAIIPVHKFGQPADMGGIMPIVHKYVLKLIEDAACALGTEYEGKKAGTFGTLGCFSLHPRKAITTGEGGAVVTNDDGLADKIRSLRNHGTVAQGGKIDFRYAGFNYRMTEFQAALGLPQLRRIEALIRHRERLAHLYDAVLSGVEGVTVPARLPRRRMVYQTYHVLLDERFDRDATIRKLREAGVETNLGAYALPLLEYYVAKYRLRPEAYPNAGRAMRQGLALPLGHHIRPRDIPLIVNKLRAAMAGA